MMKALFILLLTAGAAMAVPTGTVTCAVLVDTNGVLTGPSTNFWLINGIADTGSLGAVTADLAIVSNLTVSAISSAAVAIASADYAMTTGQAAQVTANAAMATGQTAQVTADAAISSNASVSARVTGIETNHATADQGAKADTALQGEADTLESVIARGGSFTNRIPYKYGPAIIAGMIGTSPASRMLDSGGIGFTCSNTLDNVVVTNTFYAHGTSHGTDFFHTYGSESTLFNRYVLFYDSDNFVAGTNYLAPDGSGSGLTGLTPAHVGAVWRTNEVPGFGGTTNTIIYLGAP